MAAPFIDIINKYDPGSTYYFGPHKDDDEYYTTKKGGPKGSRLCHTNTGIRLKFHARTNTVTILKKWKNVLSKGHEHEVSALESQFPAFKVSTHPVRFAPYAVGENEVSLNLEFQGDAQIATVEFEKLIRANFEKRNWAMPPL